MFPDFDSNDFEGLFLLELLVNKVEFNFAKLDLDKSVISTLQKYCVKFHFLDYPAVEACEEDFCISHSENEPFKSGKSCVFSLQDLPYDVSNLHVGAEVFGEKGDGQRMLLARACVGLGEILGAVLSDVESRCRTGPATKASKGSFPLVGGNGVDVGRLTAILRVSCLGKAGGKGCTDLGGVGDTSAFGKGIGKSGGKTNPCQDTGRVGDTRALWGPGGGVSNLGVDGLPPDGTGYGMSAFNYGIGGTNNAMGATNYPMGDANGRMGGANCGMGSNNDPMGGGASYRMGGDNYGMGGTSYAMGGTNYPMGGANYDIGSSNDPMGGAASYGMGGANYGMGGANNAMGSSNDTMGATNYGIGGSDDPMGGGASYGMGGTNNVIGGANYGIGGANNVIGGANYGMGGTSNVIGSSNYGIESGVALGPFGELLQTEEVQLPQKIEAEKLAEDLNKDVLVLKIGNRNKVGKRPKLELVLKTPKLKFDDVIMEERESQYNESDFAQPKSAPKGKKGKGKGKGKGKKKK